MKDEGYDVVQNRGVLRPLSWSRFAFTGYVVAYCVVVFGALRQPPKQIVHSFFPP